MIGKIPAFSGIGMGISESDAVELEDLATNVGHCEIISRFEHVDSRAGM